jgi:PAS domain S-box-containing protein
MPLTAKKNMNVGRMEMPNDILQWFEENRETNSLLLDSIFDGVYIVDPRRHIVFWNKGAEAITGYSKSEVMERWCGDNILNHIDEHGVLMCRTACPLMRSLHTGDNVSSKIYPKHKDDHRFPVETHIGVIRNEDEKLLAVLKYFAIYLILKITGFCRKNLALLSKNMFLPLLFRKYSLA